MLSYIGVYFSSAYNIPGAPHSENLALFRAFEAYTATHVNRMHATLRNVLVFARNSGEFHPDVFDGLDLEDLHYRPFSGGRGTNRRRSTGSNDATWNAWAYSWFQMKLKWQTSYQMRTARTVLYNPPS